MPGYKALPGLIVALMMSIFLLPTLHVWIAGNNNVLPPSEPGWAVRIFYVWGH